MLISRKSETDWEFDIRLMKTGEPDESTTAKDLKKAHLEYFYRRAFHEKACEQFSLIGIDHDDLFLQVQIYSESEEDIRSYSWLPHSIEQRGKLFYISPLYKLVRDSKNPQYPYKVVTDYLPQIQNRDKIDEELVIKELGLSVSEIGLE